MKLTSDSQTLAKNKVLILYILSKVNKPITNDTLFKLVLTIEDMNYFYFQQFLLDLLENKYLICYSQENENLYELTQDGKQVLNYTIDILPGIQKLKVDQSFKNNLNTIEDEVSILTEFQPGNKSGFIVTCKIIENSETVFEVSTLTGSREQAIQIQENWKQNASSIYPNILKILSTRETP